ncbi:hypothetical protein E5D46_21690 [Shigella boydii]|nr:hypothetical protein [Shigella boydii]
MSHIRPDFPEPYELPVDGLRGKTCIFSHSVYLFLRAFSLQDFRGGSKNSSLITVDLLLALPTLRPEK